MSGTFTRFLPYLMSGVLAALGVVALYFYFEVQGLKQEVDMLLEERNYFLLESASTTKRLRTTKNTLTAVKEELDLTEEELDDLEDDYREERNKNEEFEEQIRDITGTVRDLDKLSKTDEELLQKYSRVYFLNENYIPERLAQIDDEWILAGRKDQYFHASAWPFLEDLLEAAEDDGVDLKITSAYRSFDEQNQIKGEFTRVYGSGANAFSADQGFSEHQLGTAVDFTNPSLAALVQSFANTEEYKWLLDNAHKYGFTLSYPEENQFYIFEPWHWRFVGEDLARDLKKDEANFYDWDQREIDEYLIKIFD